MKTKIVIFGAGGHGREVADILASQARQGEAVEPHGFIDENPDLKGKRIDGLPVLGGWDWFQGVDRSDLKVVAAFGNPRLMKKVIQRAEGLELALGQAVAPSAFISPWAVLEPGVTVFPHVFLSTAALLRKASCLNVASTISHDSQVGEYAVVSPGAHVGGNVRIGEGAYLGIGCSVIQGMRVGAWSVVGGGAAVVRNIPEGVTAVGVPAKVIKRHGETGHPL